VAKRRHGVKIVAVGVSVHEGGKHWTSQTDIFLIDDSRCMLQYVDKRGEAPNNGNLFGERKGTKRDVKNIINSRNMEEVDMGTFCSDRAALCVPMELRKAFRRIPLMDPPVRPKNATVVTAFFSKCCIIPRQVGTHMGMEKIEGDMEARVYGNDIPLLNQRKPTSDFCILWTKKQRGSTSAGGIFNTEYLRREPRGESAVEKNDNMYHWINGQNVRARVIMYEWFVGPMGMSKEEKIQYSKRRGRTRKRGRSIRVTCEHADCCINPFHMYALMSEDVEKSINEEQRGVTPDVGQRVLRQMIPCVGNSPCSTSSHGRAIHNRDAKKRKRRHNDLFVEERDTRR